MLFTFFNFKVSTIALYLHKFALYELLVIDAFSKCIAHYFRQVFTNNLRINLTFYAITNLFTFFSFILNCSFIKWIVNFPTLSWRSICVHLTRYVPCSCRTLFDMDSNACLLAKQVLIAKNRPHWVFFIRDAFLLCPSKEQNLAQF